MEYHPTKWTHYGKGSDEPGTAEEEGEDDEEADDEEGVEEVKGPLKVCCHSVLCYNVHSHNRKRGRRVAGTRYRYAVTAYSVNNVHIQRDGNHFRRGVKKPTKKEMREKRRR